MAIAMRHAGTGADTTQATTSRGRAISGPRAVAIGSAVMFGLLFIDGLINERAFFDLRLMVAIQGMSLPGLEPTLGVINTLTGSPGIILFWIAMSLMLVTLWLWATAFAFAFITPGAMINLVFGLMVERTRPHLPELARISDNAEERSFPSGHTQAGIMVFGFLFMVAGRIQNPALRWTTRGFSGAVFVATPLARIWTGAHWPTDVLGGISLGLLLLVPILWLERRLFQAWAGLPLIRAGVVPVAATTEHTRALTSLVMFNRDAGTVTKMYRPGILPRLIYWAAFQAPFAYERNLDALQAAMTRRNLARRLTEFWYGTPRVAEATGISWHAGRPGLESTLVIGQAPADHKAAQAFLSDLRTRFDEVGLPTWQIEPRQPRAVDNVLETASGFMIVDLESGLVAPIATRTAWARAFRRGSVPLYDDVSFDVTRAYIEREAEAIEVHLGAAALNEIRELIDASEAATVAWHRAELRLWTTLLRAAQVVVNVRSWPRHVSAISAKGQRLTNTWLDGAVTTWEREGRLDAKGGARLREQVTAPGFQAMLPYLGAHVAMSIPLRFPLGSLIRPLMVLGAFGWATKRYLTRRMTREEYRFARGLHSPLVMILAGIPGIGSFAYLAAHPVRADQTLLRLIADESLQRVPGTLYQRTGLRRWVAGPTKPVVTRPVAPIAANPDPVATLAHPDRTSGPADRGAPPARIDRVWRPIISPNPMSSMVNGGVTTQAISAMSTAADALNTRHPHIGILVATSSARVTTRAGP